MRKIAQADTERLTIWIMISMRSESGPLPTPLTAPADCGPTPAEPGDGSVIAGCGGWADGREIAREARRVPVILARVGAEGWDSRAVDSTGSAAN